MCSVCLTHQCFDLEQVLMKNYTEFDLSAGCVEVIWIKIQFARQLLDLRCFMIEAE
jgi:hypothetical protein